MCSGLGLEYILKLDGMFMRDNLVGGGFGLEAAQKEYKDED